MLVGSKISPTYPWKIPRTFQQQFLFRSFFLGFGVWGSLGYVGKIVGSRSKLESWYLKSIIVSTAGSIHPNMWSHQLLLKVIEPTSKVTHRAPKKKDCPKNRTWLSKLPFSQYPLFQALNRHHIIDKTNLLGLLRRDGLSREEHPFHDVQRHDLFEREREKVIQYDKSDMFMDT